MIGAKSYDHLRTSHKGWVEQYLGDGAKERQDEWTTSIAVGGRPFIEKVRALGFRAKEGVSWKLEKGINSERAQPSVKLR